MLSFKVIGCVRGPTDESRSKFAIRDFYSRRGNSEKSAFKESLPRDACIKYLQHSPPEWGLTRQNLAVKIEPLWEPTLHLGPRELLYSTVHLWHSGMARTVLATNPSGNTSRTLVPQRV